MPASSTFIMDSTASRLDARPPRGREEAIELTFDRDLYDPQVVGETIDATFVDAEPL